MMYKTIFFKFVIIFSWLFLVSCSSSPNRNTQSLGAGELESESLKVQAILFYNQESGEACLLNQDKYNFRSPAVGGTYFSSYKESKNRFSKISPCGKAANKTMQKGASVAFNDGPQLAGVPVALGYYLACTANLAAMDQTNKLTSERQAKGIHDTRTKVQEAVYLLTGLATFTVCLPATGVNAGLIYVFTNEEM